MLNQISDVVYHDIYKPYYSIFRTVEEEEKDRNQKIRELRDLVEAADTSIPNSQYIKQPHSGTLLEELSTTQFLYREAMKLKNLNSLIKRDLKKKSATVGKVIEKFSKKSIIRMEFKDLILKLLDINLMQREQAIMELINQN